MLAGAQSKPGYYRLGRLAAEVEDCEAAGAEFSGVVHLAHDTGGRERTAGGRGTYAGIDGDATVEQT